MPPLQRDIPGVYARRYTSSDVTTYQSLKIRRATWHAQSTGIQRYNVTSLQSPPVWVGLYSYSMGTSLPQKRQTRTPGQVRGGRESTQHRRGSRLLYGTVATTDLLEAFCRYSLLGTRGESYKIVRLASDRAPYGLVRAHRVGLTTRSSTVQYSTVYLVRFCSSKSCKKSSTVLVCFGQNPGKHTSTTHSREAYS